MWVALRGVVSLLILILLREFKKNKKIYKDKL